jgi:ABC-type sugar transport system substrate-binding protein
MRWWVVPLLGLMLLSTVYGGATHAASPARSAAAKLVIGWSYYTIGTPFVQQVEQGAKAAAHDFGVTLITGGTPTVDNAALAQIVRSQITAGANGIVTPGTDQNAAVLKSWGGTFTTVDEQSPTLKTVFIGETPLKTGQILGMAAAKKLVGAAAHGTVLVGNCFPGITLLDLRSQGTKEGLLSVAPGLTVKIFKTDPDLSQNYTAWTQEFSANPNAVALLGMCSTDTVSIGKINQAHGLRLVGAGYNLTPAILQALANRLVFLAIDPPAYLTGYLPVQLLVQSLRSHRPIPWGFIPIQVNMVTPANVQTFINFQTHPELQHAYYAKRIPKDLFALIQPPQNATAKH